MHTPKVGKNCLWIIPNRNHKEKVTWLDPIQTNKHTNFYVPKISLKLKEKKFQRKYL